MTPDPNRRSLRQFQCRDYLWEAFEQMAQEQGCAIDSLLNESMRQYARSRDRGGPMADIPEQLESAPGPARGAPPGAFRPGAPPPTMAPPNRVPSPPARPPLGPMGPPGQPSMRPAGMPSMPGAPPRLPPMGPPGAPVRPSMAPMAPPNAPPRPAPPGVANRVPGPPMMPGAPPRPMPAPAPMAPPPMAPPAAQGRQTGTLFAVYEGQSYPVQKEEFVIGRGQKVSDLTIRDSNVSRRHACVVLYNNQYWIVDQQSTNGVEYKGAKIDRKVVEDGDVYKICDHEIRFMYR